MTFGIDALLQAALPKHAAREAFRCGEATISYAELDARARALASLLCGLGVAKGDRVGIAMTKGVEMPVALHGIWMAGAAFVPMDPTAPPARLARVAQECEIKILISADRSKRLVAAITAEHPATIVGTQVDGMACHQMPQTAPDGFTPVVNTLDDIAYIMFTSGSTGVPKGMVHTHGSGRAFAEMWADLYQLRADDVFFTTTPLHFDFSLADFFAGPIAGAVTELVPEGVQNFPASIGALLEKSGASIWSTVPFALIQLTERGATETRDLSRLRWVLFGGEPMSPHAISALREVVPAQISNSYGPAEVNQVSEYTVPTDQPLDQPVPIGVPTPHATFVEDEDGILLVAAPSMMRGYWRRPDLDAKAFVDRDGQRFYRTGDLVSRGDDGLWRFGGRADRQVKVRGHRVELDEVEHALAAHADVSEAAAVLSSDRMTLVGFVTLHPDAAETEPAGIRAHVMSQLPPYAVPATVTIQQQFQRTTTGKIDRRVLEHKALQRTI